MKNYIFKNPNPFGLYVGDCVIRAISIATGKSWNEVYIDLVDLGYKYKNLPNANNVWGEYLERNGFIRHVLPDTCPVCYTVNKFCNDYPIGVFILATGTHVVAVKDGRYYDAWDSGDEVPVFYYERVE